jgi:hypothetical protein
MQVKGISKRTLLEKLESRSKEDFTYDSGKIIGFICTSPHSRTLFPRHIQIVVMPHVHEEHDKDFLEDLSEVVNELRRR